MEAKIIPADFETRIITRDATRLAMLRVFLDLVTPISIAKVITPIKAQAATRLALPSNP
jgi:hypothetical protein